MIASIRSKARKATFRSVSIQNQIENLHETLDGKRHRAGEEVQRKIYSCRSRPISCRNPETDSTFPRRASARFMAVINRRAFLGDRSK